MDLRVLAIFVIVAFLHPMTTKVTILCYYFLSIESLGASLNRSIADLTYLLFYLFLARAHGTYCKSYSCFLMWLYALCYNFLIDAASNPQSLPRGYSKSYMSV